MLIVNVETKNEPLLDCLSHCSFIKFAEVKYLISECNNWLSVPRGIVKSFNY